MLDKRRDRRKKLQNEQKGRAKNTNVCSPFKVTGSSQSSVTRATFYLHFFLLHAHPTDEDPELGLSPLSLPSCIVKPFPFISSLSCSWRSRWPCREVRRLSRNCAPPSICLSPDACDLFFKKFFTFSSLRFPPRSSCTRLCCPLARGKDGPEMNASRVLLHVYA